MFGVGCLVPQRSYARTTKNAIGFEVVFETALALAFQMPQTLGFPRKHRAQNCAPFRRIRNAIWPLSVSRREATNPHCIVCRIRCRWYGFSHWEVVIWCVVLTEVETSQYTDRTQPSVFRVHVSQYVRHVWTNVCALVRIS